MCWNCTVVLTGEFTFTRNFVVLSRDMYEYTATQVGIRCVCFSVLSATQLRSNVSLSSSHEIRDKGNVCIGRTTCVFRDLSIRLQDDYFKMTTEVIDCFWGSRETVAHTNVLTPYGRKYMKFLEFWVKLIWSEVQLPTFAHIPSWRCLRNTASEVKFTEQLVVLKVISLTNFTSRLSDMCTASHIMFRHNTYITWLKYIWPKRSVLNITFPTFTLSSLGVLHCFWLFCC